MGRWEPLPPTRLQRWIAQHVLGLQIGLICLAVATATFVIVAVSTQGWDVGAVTGVLSTVVYLLAIRWAREIARDVADSDRRHSSCST